MNTSAARPPLVLLLIGLLLAGETVLAMAGRGSAAAAVLGPTASARTAPARAAPDPVDVEIDTVAPTALTPAATLTVRGRIMNTTAAELTAVYIRLRYRYDALSKRSDLQKWAAGEPGLTMDANEPNRHRTRQTLTGPLPARASTGFQFTVAARLLGLPETEAAFGSRGLMVEVFADRPGLGSQKVGAGYSFVVWDPVPSRHYTKITALVPVSSALAQPDASEPSDPLIAGMEPGGRLGRLVRTVAGTGISWAIDPALLDAARRAQSPGSRPTIPPSATATAVASRPPVATASDPTVTPRSTARAGVPVASRAVTTVPAVTPGPRDVPGTAEGTAPATAPGTTGTGVPADAGTAQARTDTATAWLAGIAGVAATNPPLVLPFGDPDLAALAHNRGGALLDLARERADSTTRQILGTRPRTSIAWPVDGRADPATTALLTGQSWQAVVLASSSQPPAAAADQSGTPSGRSSVPRPGTPLSGLLYDDELSHLLGELGAPGVTESGATLIRQRLLAELATITAERPGEPRHLLLAAPRGWDPDPDLVSQVLNVVDQAPWVQPQSTDALLAEQPAAVPRTGLQYPAEARAAEVPGSVVNAMVRTENALQAFSPVLTQPQLILPDLQRQEISLVAAVWRGHTAAELATARTPLQTRVNAVLGSVTVLTGSDANLLSHSGRLPITVRNQLDQQVKVRLVLRSHLPLLRLGSRKPLVIGAHGNHTVVFPFRAAGNGSVQVDASLWTVPAGDEPIYEAPPFVVRVHSNWETIGLTVSGAVLGLLVLLGLVRSIRRGRNPLPPESAPDPEEVLVHQESGRTLPDVLQRMLGRAGPDSGRDDAPAGTSTDPGAATNEPRDNRTGTADTADTAGTADERSARKLP